MTREPSLLIAEIQLVVHLERLLFAVVCDDVAGRGIGGVDRMGGIMHGGRRIVGVLHMVVGVGMGRVLVVVVAGHS